MKYRTNQKNGDSISQLAFGCMRLPRDEREAERLVHHAIDQGVNYFDTAYIYPGNEALLGRILSNGYRDKVNIATKMPPYLIKKSEDFDKVFGTQLSRLQTDRVEYYLLHMLPNVGEWERLKSLGMLEWVARKKQSGQIKSIGFSYHGGVPEFIQLIDAHEWDFCMIQYNYFDVNSQAGNKGLLYAAEKGVPLMIMEPLRGGRLATGLPPDVAALWRHAPGERSLAEWALRWVWNHPEALTVLSGMNTQAMLDENIRIASEAEADSLSPDELALFDEARQLFMEKTLVPCTGCNYCMPCPFGVDIPMCFSAYNDRALIGKPHAWFNYVLRTMGHNASLCTRCGKCEPHCPQSIPIRDSLAEVSGRMERLLYKPVRFAVKKFMKLK